MKKGRADLACRVYLEQSFEKARELERKANGARAGQLRAPCF